MYRTAIRFPSRQADRLLFCFLFQSQSKHNGIIRPARGIDHTVGYHSPAEEDGDRA